MDHKITIQQPTWDQELRAKEGISFEPTLVLGREAAESLYLGLEAVNEREDVVLKRSMRGRNWIGMKTGKNNRTNKKSLYVVMILYKIKCSMQHLFTALENGALMWLIF